MTGHSVWVIRNALLNEKKKFRPFRGCYIIESCYEDHSAKMKLKKNAYLGGVLKTKMGVRMKFCANSRAVYK